MTRGTFMYKHMDTQYAIMLQVDTNWMNKPIRSLGYLNSLSGGDRVSDGWPPLVRSGVIRRIYYRLTPTAAVTYRLSLYQSDVGANNSVELQSDLLYDSGAGKVSGTVYDNAVVTPFNLRDPGCIWYSIDWSAAPGATTGFIVVSGDRDMAVMRN